MGYSSGDRRESDTTERLTLLLSLVAQRYRIRLPTQEIWVRSLGWGDPMEMETATHSSLPAWEIPWTERSGRLQSIGL